MYHSSTNDILIFATEAVVRLLVRLMSTQRIKWKNGAVESKTIPQIYDEEAAAASTEPSTCGQFPIFKEVRSVMYKQRAKRFPKLPRDR
ncbi:hypothetical protein T11_6820 [Trichinella zimbabwensis]|uniref:Uncharacterized protein n=1 Tax=Trichinella zimbabwensis TaxID=268475 RepID=A0A0V1HMT2_9BILA|nr:hypothetical protein T11_6820 [Trichinella zimbabwensis]